MQNLKCIVAATDFFAAGRAVSRAVLIARQQSAELHLLPVSPLALRLSLAA